MINVTDYTCLHCYHSFCTLEMSKEIVKCPICKSTNVSSTAYTPKINILTKKLFYNDSYRW
jgi:hypothetical protein